MQSPYPPAEHITALAEHAAALAVAAEAAGLSAPVPACPGWCVEQLVRHTGYVHRWVAGVLRTGGDAPPAEDDADEVVAAAGPADPDDLPGWFRDGWTDLVALLRAIPDDHRAWYFLPAPTARGFWARRMANETAVHRADAEAAAGRRTSFAPAFASDGLDELIMSFGARSARRWHDSEAVVVTASATDTGDCWSVRSGPEGGSVSRGLAEQLGPARHADLRGPASELYLFLWNRGGRDGLAVGGDPSVLDWWAEHVRVRWS